MSLIPMFKVKITENSVYILEQQQRDACFVLATNVAKNKVSDEEILINYKK